MNNNIIELDEANFDREVLNAMKPVLVEFWASWSAPCMVMGRMLASMISDDALCVKFTRVNIENCENLTEQCGVETVPTLLLYNQGCLRDRVVGNATELALRERIRSIGGISTQENLQLQETRGIGIL